MGFSRDCNRQFQNVGHIAVDFKTGNIFVGDQGNERIQKFYSNVNL